ncbi:MAG: TonB-dependent receptor [Melioribacteraceae bacterium]|nr:TonB-dependent receptor [Melioribacteraceae bacterium]
MFRKMLFSILFIASITYSQNITLKGNVTDSEFDLPIHGAIVFINNNYYYTNSNGNFWIPNLSEKEYSIKVYHLGYKSIDKNIVIDSSTPQLMQFDLIPTIIEMDEVIVSSQKTGKVLRQSPYSENLVTQAELQVKPFQSLSDALDREAGLAIIRDGMWGTEISIRGMNRQNIVALVDGNRMETATDLAARFSLVDLSDIERIEVIKGAASSIYGSGATGGVVNIVSKSPYFNEDFYTSGNVSTGYNSVNNSSLFSGAVFSGSSIWSAKLSGSFRKADDYKSGLGTTVKNSRFKDYSFSGAFNFIPTENHLLKLDYQLFKAEDVGIPGAEPLFPANADLRYPIEKREMIAASYEIQNISDVITKLTAKFSHQFIVRDVENIPHIVQNVPASGTNPARRVSVLKILPGADHNNNSAQVFAELSLAPTNKLVVGIDYWKRDYEGLRTKEQMIEVLNPAGAVVKTIYKTIAESPLPNSSFQSIGIFAQDEAQVIEDVLKLSIGARLDRIDVKGDKTLNPLYDITDGVRNDHPAGQSVIWNDTNFDDISYSGNVGAIYSLTKNLDFTLSLGYSFRSPSLEERFQYIDQGSVVRLGNPSLDPEKSKSIDFGIRYYGNNYKLISSIFYNNLTDLVVEVPGTFEGRAARIKQNVGEARLYGFDLSYQNNFYGDNVFFSSLSFVKGDDITNDTSLPEIAPLNGTLGVTISIVKNLQAEVSSTLFAVQNDPAPGEKATKGYALFNASLVTKPILYGGMNFRISAGVENLFDKAYVNHLSTNRGLSSIDPGRNIYLKLYAGF